jgi:hypothetical protein
MLGHLRMNVDEAIDALINVATAVVTGESQYAADPEANLQHLKEAIEEMLQTREIHVNYKMYERERPQKRCKVYVILHHLFLWLNSYQNSLCGNIGQ